MDDRMNGFQQQIKPMLRPHGAETNNQEVLAFLWFQACRPLLHPHKVGATSQNKCALATHLSLSQRHFTVGLVGDNRDAGSAEGQALSPASQLISKASAFEFGFVQLGIEIVMFEEEVHAKEYKEKPRQENLVGWIKGVPGAEGGARVDSRGQAELRGKRLSVRGNMAWRA
jgi:hypothetical protein